MTIQMAAEISNTALCTLAKGERIFKTECAVKGTKRLAGLRRIDLDVLPCEVLLFVIFSFCPVRDLLNLLSRRAALKLLFAFELFLILLFGEQLTVVLYLELYHDILRSAFVIALFFPSDELPGWAVHRRIHVPGKDRETIKPMIRSRIIPRMHLPERYAHLVVCVLLLDSSTHQIGPYAVGELLQLIFGSIVHDQGTLFHVGVGALIIVVVGEFVTTGDHFHTEVFVGPDGVTRPQTANIEHDFLALKPGTILFDHRIHLRLVLGDDLFSLFLDRIVELCSDLPDARIYFCGAKEIELDPRNAVFFLHVTAYVVHGAVAVNQIQFRLVRNPYLIDGSVSGPLGNDAQAHFLKNLSGGPCIAADVVIANERDIIRRCCFERPLSENVISNRVVCDMV